jgi:DNA invertase Pin-like site-specific DNA recombinase
MSSSQTSRSLKLLISQGSGNFEGLSPEPLYEDRMSGLRADRPQLAQALAYATEGDVLVVWRLDRLGRSLPHLIETVSTLE